MISRPDSIDSRIIGWQLRYYQPGQSPKSQIDYPMAARFGIRRIPAWLLGFALVLAVTLLAFLILRSYEDNSANDNFQAAAVERLARLQDELDEALSALTALGAYYDASPEIDRNQFHRLTQPFLAQKLPIQALEWIPRVARAERSSYVDAARRSGYQNFDFTEQHTQQRLRPAGQRAEYYPVYFVNPYVGNEKALGFDLGSNPQRRATLEASMTSGEMVATERITLIQERSDQYGLLVFRPVYQGGILPASRSERLRNLKGFVLAVFRLGDLVEEGGRNRKFPAQLVVFDDTASAGSHLLYPKRLNIDSTEALPARIKLVRKILVAGRTWTIVCMPKPGAFVPHRYTSTAALALGLLASLLWAAYLRQKTAQLGTIERTVVERTRQLDEERAFSVAIFDAAGEIVLVIDRQGTIVRFNKAAEAFTGYSFEEVKGRPFFWMQFVPPEQRDNVEAAFRQFQAGTLAKNFENYWISRSGQQRLFAWVNTALRDSAGVPQFLVTMGLDITDRKQTELALQEITERFGRTAKTVPVVLYDYVLNMDGSTRFSYVSERSSDILGVDSETVMKDSGSIWRLIHPDDLSRVQEEDVAASASGEDFSTQFRIITPAGVLKWLRVEARPSRARIGEQRSWSGFIQDITDYKRTEDELRTLATTDFLTGLSTRRSFIIRLEDELARLHRAIEQPVALLMLDLDHFKQVNDRYGHAVGDAVLKLFAEIIADELRRIDMAGRLGGEEFGVVLPGADGSAARTFAERLRHRVANSPLLRDGRRISFSVSIGITHLRSADTDTDQVLARADAALYRAKELGRNRVEVAEDA